MVMKRLKTTEIYKFLPLFLNKTKKLFYFCYSLELKESFDNFGHSDLNCKQLSLILIRNIRLIIWMEYLSESLCSTVTQKQTYLSVNVLSQVQLQIPLSHKYQMKPKKTDLRNLYVSHLKKSWVIYFFLIIKFLRYYYYYYYLHTPARIPHTCVYTKPSFHSVFFASLSFLNWGSFASY